MNKWGGLLMFFIGAGTGSLLTWQYTKKKYETIAQEEIDSVKEAFSKRSEHKVDTNEQECEKYTDLLKHLNYISKEEMTVKKPYVISPEEFGEISEYDTVSLTYYADQVLVDENNEEVEDVEGTVGYKSLTRFGEYEADSVFVRNDRLRCDYEILMDNRPYQREDE